MAVRSSSPISESLLWRARLTQHNAHLKKETDALKAQVKELFERITAVEAKAQCSATLELRLAAVEDDGRSQQEHFEALDHERREKMQNLEEDNMAFKRKVGFMGERIDDLVEEHGKEVKRREENTLLAVRIQKLEADFAALVQQGDGFKTELRMLNDSSTKETGVLQLHLKSLEGEIKAIKAECTAFASKNDTQHVQMLSENRQQPVQQPVQQPTHQSTKPVLAKSRKQVTKLVRSTKAPKTEPQANATPARRGAAPASGQKEARQQLQEQAVTQAPVVWRSRTTRQGRSGWHQTQQPGNLNDNTETLDATKEEQALGGAEDVEVRNTSRLQMLPRKRHLQAQDDEKSEEYRSRSSNQHTKRAKKPPTVPRLFPNLRLPVEAGYTNGLEPQPKETVAPIFVVVPSNMQSTPVNALGPDVAKPTENLLLVAATVSDQQTNLRQGHSASTKRTYRPPRRMPNLPPTPPPPSP